MKQLHQEQNASNTKWTFHQCSNRNIMHLFSRNKNTNHREKAKEYLSKCVIKIYAIYIILQRFFIIIAENRTSAPFHSILCWTILLFSCLLRNQTQNVYCLTNIIYCSTQATAVGWLWGISCLTYKKKIYSIPVLKKVRAPGRKNKGNIYIASFCLF